MVDTFPDPMGGKSDALAGDRSRARTPSVCSRSREWSLVDDGTLSPVRHQPPFASTGIHGLNRLNVWWLQLGISHQRITPGSPQENGAHERLHKTLKTQVARPPAANLNLQQRVFNQFQVTYNDLRPHEALEDNTPASRWTPSPRPFAERIAPPEYPGHFEVRRVSNAGTFRLHSASSF